MSVVPTTLDYSPLDAWQKLQQHANSFDSSGSTVELDCALDLQNQVLEGARSGALDTVQVKTLVSRLLLDRSHQHMKSEAQSEAALKSCYELRQELYESSSNDHERQQHLIGVVEVLQEREYVLGDSRAAHQAVELCRDENHRFPSSLMTFRLAQALSDSYALSGIEAELDEAISLYPHLVDTVDFQHEVLSLFVNIYWNKSNIRDHPTWTLKCIDLLIKDIDLFPNPPLRRPDPHYRQMQIAKFSQEIFTFLPQADDIGRLAIKTLFEALGIFSDDPDICADIHHQLGNSFGLYCAFDKAVSHYRQASVVAETFKGDHLVTYGHVLASNNKMTYTDEVSFVEITDVLKEGIRHLEQLEDDEEDVGPDKPRKYEALNLAHHTLARLYHRRSVCLAAQAEADVELAIHHFRLASADPPNVDILQVQLASVTGWVDCAGYHGHCSVEEALRNYSKMMSAAIEPVVGRATQYLELRNSILEEGDWKETGLMDHFLGCSIVLHTKDDLKAAIQLFEQSRNFVWRNLAIQHSELVKLRRLDPALADEHEVVRCNINDIHGSIGASDNLPFDPRMKLTDLRDKQQEILGRIRGVAGLDRFQLPWAYENLVKATKRGPIVIISSLHIKDQSRQTVAIVLRQDKEPVRLPLLQMGPSTVRELYRMLYPSTRVAPHRSRGESRDGCLYDPDDQWSEKYPPLKHVLRRLWEGLVKPVFDCIGLEATDDPLRLWWIPAGLLASLPIHAAGIYDNGSSVSCDQYVISSYAPSLDVLLRDTEETEGSLRILAISQEATPGQRPLPYTVKEVKAIQSIVPPESFEPLHGSSATVDTVVQRLTAAHCLHVACHGDVFPQDPANSAIYLADGTLPITRIMQENLVNARFVFLSACKTSAGDPALPDEAMHLAAAMLYAGFKGAIATMWAIADEDGPVVAEAVYRSLTSSGHLQVSDAARALHNASRTLREKGRPFHCWVPFVHFGI